MSNFEKPSFCDGSFILMLLSDITEVIIQSPICKIICLFPSRIWHITIKMYSKNTVLHILKRSVVYTICVVACMCFPESILWSNFITLCPKFLEIIDLCINFLVWMLANSESQDRPKCFHQSLRQIFIWSLEFVPRHAILCVPDQLTQITCFI